MEGELERTACCLYCWEAQWECSSLSKTPGVPAGMEAQPKV